MLSVFGISCAERTPEAQDQTLYACIRSGGFESNLAIVYGSKGLLLAEFSAEGRCLRNVPLDREGEVRSFGFIGESFVLLCKGHLPSVYDPATLTQKSNIEYSENKPFNSTDIHPSDEILCLGLRQNGLYEVRKTFEVEPILGASFNAQCELFVLSRAVAGVFDPISHTLELFDTVRGVRIRTYSPVNSLRRVSPASFEVAVPCTGKGRAFARAVGSRAPALGNGEELTLPVAMRGHDLRVLPRVQDEHGWLSMPVRRSDLSVDFVAAGIYRDAVDILELMRLTEGGILVSRTVWADGDGDIHPFSVATCVVEDTRGTRVLFDDLTYQERDKHGAVLHESYFGDRFAGEKAAPVTFSCDKCLYVLGSDSLYMITSKLQIKEANVTFSKEERLLRKHGSSKIGILKDGILKVADLSDLFEANAEPEGAVAGKFDVPTYSKLFLCSDGIAVWSWIDGSLSFMPFIGVSTRWSPKNFRDQQTKAFAFGDYIVTSGEISMRVFRFPDAEPLWTVKALDDLVLHVTETQCGLYLTDGSSAYYLLVDDADNRAKLVEIAETSGWTATHSSCADDLVIRAEDGTPLRMHRVGK
ncbi:MAG: hypothetical protein U5N86_04420 [Planctomycetota bacterium]|nr:hypothetical protein [Planctomycetota bacterium]